MLTLLAPANHYRAIEERYAQWQSELLLTREGNIPIVRFEPDTPLQPLLNGIATEFTAVLTNPLIAVPPATLQQLMATLQQLDVKAVLPASSEDVPAARHLPPPALYLTLRQFEEVAAVVAGSPSEPATLIWGDDNPNLFVMRTEELRRRGSLELRGAEVAVDRRLYIHVFASQRGQPRLDLLERISTDAREVLEFGCGEGALGAALKQRQPCRVTGIELDLDAAVIARTRLDEVHTADVRTLLGRIEQRFDSIIGGDVLEHLDEPWSFLSDLRQLARPGARLLLSLPNIAHFSIVGDLLRGRFDYVYLGITCAGHLRFFTRQSIADMLTIAGWKVREIEPQEPFPSPELEEMLTRLAAAGLPALREDLAPPGWYVHAEA